MRDDAAKSAATMTSEPKTAEPKTADTTTGDATTGDATTVAAKRAAEKPALCISIHDVAPATWPQCRQLIATLREVADLPLGLLLVPRWHGERLDAGAGFIAALQALLDDGRGHEVLLHGLYHVDDAHAPTGLGACLQRRVLTRGEGEFAALGAAAAMARVRAGVADLHGCGLRDVQVAGFVPPAWLMSRSARTALLAEGSRLGLRYASLFSGLLDLQQGHMLRAPALVYSARWPITDVLTRAAVGSVAAMMAGAPLLRLGLHPADVQRAGNLRHAQRLVERALRDRLPLTEGQWLQGQITTHGKVSILQEGGSREKT